MFLKARDGALLFADDDFAGEAAAATDRDDDEALDFEGESGEDFVNDDDNEIVDAFDGDAETGVGAFDEDAEEGAGDNATTLASVLEDDFGEADCCSAITFSDAAAASITLDIASRLVEASEELQWISPRRSSRRGILRGSSISFISESRRLALMASPAILESDCGSVAAFSAVDEKDRSPVARSDPVVLINLFTAVSYTRFRISMHRILEWIFFCFLTMADR